MHLAVSGQCLPVPPSYSYTVSNVYTGYLYTICNIYESYSYSICSIYTGVPVGQVVRPPVHRGNGPGFEAPLRQGFFKPFLTLGPKSESAPHSLLTLRAGELIW